MYTDFEPGKSGETGLYFSPKKIYETKSTVYMKEHYGKYRNRKKVSCKKNTG